MKNRTSSPLFGFLDDLLGLEFFLDLVHVLALFTTDLFVFFCFFDLHLGLDCTFGSHLGAQLGELFLFFLFCEGFDLSTPTHANMSVSRDR